MRFIIFLMLYVSVATQDRGSASRTVDLGTDMLVEWTQQYFASKGHVTSWATMRNGILLELHRWIGVCVRACMCTRMRASLTH